MYYAHTVIEFEEIIWRKFWTSLVFVTLICQTKLLVNYELIFEELPENGKKNRNHFILIIVIMKDNAETCYTTIIYYFELF